MNQKKIAAALAGVAAYIRIREEEALAAATQNQEAGKPEPASVPQIIPKVLDRPFNLWGISGRQIQMAARTRIQLGMFRKT